MIEMMSKRAYQKSGTYTLKAAVKKLGSRAIDRRTSVGKALAAWRQALDDDFGGDLSVQQSAFVDLYIKQKLLLDSIDAWLFPRTAW